MPNLNSVLSLLEFLYKNPFAVFIILSAVFGYLYFDQNKQIIELSLEVGGLRVEQEKMHEIIKLTSKQCNSKGL